MAAELTAQKVALADPNSAGRRAPPPDAEFYWFEDRRRSAHDRLQQLCTGFTATGQAGALITVDVQIGARSAPYGRTGDEHARAVGYRRASSTARITILAAIHVRLEQHVQPLLPGRRGSRFRRKPALSIDRPRSLAEAFEEAEVFRFPMPGAGGQAPSEFHADPDGDDR